MECFAVEEVINVAQAAHSLPRRLISLHQSRQPPQTIYWDDDDYLILAGIQFFFCKTRQRADFLNSSPVAVTLLLNSLRVNQALFESRESLILRKFKQKYLVS
jgi:hypothetical protein